MVWPVIKIHHRTKGYRGGFFVSFIQYAGLKRIWQKCIFKVPTSLVVSCFCMGGVPSWLYKSAASKNGGEYGKGHN